jgi:cytochrome c peroxidase
LRLAGLGKQIFDRQPEQGGCGPTCHEIKDGRQRLFNRNTWATPQWDVGTDNKEYQILVRTADAGVLKGAFIPVVMTAPLQSRDKVVNILRASVLGSILQEPLKILKYLEADPSQPLRLAPLDIDPLALGSPLVVLNQKLSQELRGAYKSDTPDRQTDPAPFKYEARVLKGIWATAPYLHNGSVPTLVELLKPSSERVDSFKIGPAYDLNEVGLAKDQSKFDFIYQTTDCSKRSSGNSRCGHEFGTKLSVDEKKALLEYLKQL